MRFDGAFTVHTSVKRAMAIVVDVDRVAGCVPGVSDVTTMGPGSYRGTMRVRLGPVAATFELTGTLTTSDVGATVGLRGRERLTGTLVEGSFDASVAAHGGGARVDWTLDVVLRGRLGQMGQAVLGDVVKRSAEQTVECLHRTMAAT